MELIFEASGSIDESNMGLAIIADMAVVYGVNHADATTLYSTIEDEDERLECFNKIHHHMLSHSDTFSEQFLGVVRVESLLVEDVVCNHLIFIPLSLVSDGELHDITDRSPISIRVFNDLDETVKVTDDGSVPLCQLSDTPAELVNDLMRVWKAMTKKHLLDNDPFFFDEQSEIVHCRPLAHYAYSGLMFKECGASYVEMAELWVDYMRNLILSEDKRTERFANALNTQYIRAASTHTSHDNCLVKLMYLALIDVIKNLNKGDSTDVQSIELQNALT